MVMQYVVAAFPVRHGSITLVFGVVFMSHFIMNCHTLSTRLKANSGATANPAVLQNLLMSLVGRTPYKTENAEDARVTQSPMM